MLKDADIRQRFAVTLGQGSDAGRKAVNQDFHGAMIPTGAELDLKGITLALADGISSSAVSAEAAETTVKSLLGDYYATPDAWTARVAACRVIAATNAWLFGQNSDLDDIDRGRVCTLSVLILKGREAHVLHVGDSRVTLLRGGAIEVLTEDHQTRLASGEIYLSRAIGSAAHVEIDYRRIALEPGDIFVLSSDGVHDYLTQAEITAALAAPPDDAAADLLARALANGSPDNVTVQVLRVDALPPEDAPLVPEEARLPVPPLPQPGGQIDGYRVLRQIHASDRSHVFLASDADGRRFALKIPAGELAADAETRRRFVLEEWIARRVTSPHVLAVPERTAPRSSLYVVTEYVDGQTLRQWMTDTPAPSLGVVRDLLGQIAAGLRALHRRQMIHQDIRPENIMIDREGLVKIIDLGSATVAGVEEAAPGTLGEMPGTLQYTAPEYLSGDVVSWRSDQFALGVIAYEMLTGRLPYGAQASRVTSRADQRRLRYRPARDDDSSVPDWIDLALRRALHPDPLRRYDALSEFCADLARPGAGWTAQAHRPLIERHPLRFWQGLSAVLAILCLILAIQLASQ
ncbi:bifunctional protein-serine/threonine kinase/phosphatase [Pseudooceanicola algae]|uniref:Serine/threonine-protein kinase PknD n=1 Tax=Pseudooceanicola algae TaxID=1537215 RepID=A0A418SIR9_9RHOB|nr:bifunctional protein-serine/threonine kinase/phosphatase [Pseudooceanicola algae]QPM91213.1 Serine/threonine-protein kinase PknD [Pseudooceanicola algae]